MNQVMAGTKGSPNARRGWIRLALIGGVILSNVGVLWFVSSTNERRRVELRVLAAEMARMPQKVLTSNAPFASSNARDAVSTLTAALGRGEFKSTRCRVTATGLGSQAMGYLEVKFDERGVVQDLLAEGPVVHEQELDCLRTLLLHKAPTNPHRSSERVIGPVEVRLGLMPYRTMFE